MTRTTHEDWTPGTRPPRPPHPPRRWWLWPLVAVAVLAYALVFGEFFLRWLQPQAIVPRYVTGGADGIRANMPGVSFRQWTPEVDVRVHYNAAGMRDDRPPPPLAKPAGQCRVALLGDSYFVGFESSWRNSFAARLEQALAARGKPCRVLNFAVSGFGDAEMLIALHTRVQPWHPDLVVASFHTTDSNDNLRSNLFRLGDDGSLQRAAATYLPGVAISDRLNANPAYRWIQENSHFYSAAREWLGTTGKHLLTGLRARTADEADAEPMADAAATSDPSASVSPRDMALNRALIQALRADSRAMGAEFLLFDIPVASLDHRAYHSFLTRHLGRDITARTPVASPLARFRQQPVSVQLYLERGQRHWTSAGNRLAAEVAADTILADHLLP